MLIERREELLRKRERRLGGRLKGGMEGNGIEGKDGEGEMGMGLPPRSGVLGQ